MGREIYIYSMHLQEREKEWENERARECEIEKGRYIGGRGREQEVKREYSRNKCRGRDRQRGE